MGLRDDIEDAPGKEPVLKLEPIAGDELKPDDLAMMIVSTYAAWALDSCNEHLAKGRLSAPVEAALHDFSMGLDDLIKETLGKVRSDD